MDGITFTKNLHDNIAIKRRQSNESIQIWYFHYMLWALRKKEIGIMIENSHSQYSFLSTVLKLIWAMVPQNIKGELWPDTNSLLRNFVTAEIGEVKSIQNILQY